MKKITFLLVTLFSLTISFGQNAWKKTDEAKVGNLEKVSRNSTPRTFQLFQLDLEKFKQELVSYE